MLKQFSKKTNMKNNNIGHKKVSYTWAVIIIIWTFILSITISFFSSSLMKTVSIGVAFIILIFIIFLGIIFDIIGIAVTAADEIPFHSMGSRKIIGAKQAVKIIRNAEKVSNFCNDVVGDIAGIISGTTSATIVMQISQIYNISDTVMIGLILTGFVASLTVGGKAIGKSIAIIHSHFIVYKVSIIVYYFDKLFNFKKKTKQRKRVEKDE